MENLKHILEALIFVSAKPLELRRIKEVLPDVESADILRAIDEIRSDYENRDGGFTLKEIAGGYQFRTRSAYQQYIHRLVQAKPIRLSKATLETLAIIAYKQPITRVEVDHIRGVDSSNILRLLLERKLIRVLGRREVPGRPLIYVTTRYFLELFELKDLKDLPTPREIEEMGSGDEPDYEEIPSGSLDSPLPPDALDESENIRSEEAGPDYEETPSESLDDPPPFDAIDESESGSSEDADPDYKEIPPDPAASSPPPDELDESETGSSENGDPDPPPSV